MKRQIFVFLVVLGMVLGVRVYAADIYVPGSYTTIQAAIDAATNGDRILVSDGTYTGTGNKNLSWSGKCITVMSINGSDNCIIDCENSGRGFYFGDSGTISVIYGFTIRNGYVAGDYVYGGGISCRSSSPSITNCTIINCTVMGNYYGCGGGICCGLFSSPSIVNCNIIGNQALGGCGGGIYCADSSPSITNCNIIENYSLTGGSGIHCEGGYSSPSITNCNIIGNRGGESAICRWKGSLAINYNNVWNNTPNNYSGCSPNIGNISSDPEFAGGSDYNLKPISPCIDKGTNTAPGIPVTDKDGNPRIVNGIV
ncbi:MAG: hypothetical protein AB1630_10470 [bacterium]